MSNLESSFTSSKSKAEELATPIKVSLSDSSAYPVKQKWIDQPKAPHQGPALCKITIPLQKEQWLTQQSQKVVSQSTHSLI